METYEQEFNKSDKIHYKKINIFGDEGVGKTSLISYLEDYDKFELNNDSISYSARNSVKPNSSIVEKVKKTVIKSDNVELHLNIYETNLNAYNSIQMNLDTLLVQTELIIIMWDYSEPESFDNVIKLVDTIESGISNNQFRNVEIILIQNKTDLEINNSKASRTDEKKINQQIQIYKNKYSNISYKKLSLLNKDKDEYYDLILDIKRKIEGNNEAINMVKFKYPFNFQENQRPDKKYTDINILLLGSAGTGKTSFIRTLEEKRIEDLKPTLEFGDRSPILSEIINEKIKIIISDTVGQEKFKSLPQNMYKKADGFLIFFDVTNKDSFNEIDYYFKRIDENTNSKGIILLGNKIDDNDRRIISKQKAKDVADKKEVKYFEISCLNGINILETLNEIALIAYKNYKFKNENNNNNKSQNKNNVQNDKKNNDINENNNNSDIAIHVKDSQKLNNYMNNNVNNNVNYQTRNSINKKTVEKKKGGCC